jgi:hypothetical protein
MTHPLIGSEIFVETAFERRFQAMLRSALHKRSWHVIVAGPGAGKTMGIRDLIRTTGSPAIWRSRLLKTMKRNWLWATNCSQPLGCRCEDGGATESPNSWGRWSSLASSA